MGEMGSENYGPFKKDSFMAKNKQEYQEDRNDHASGFCKGGWRPRIEMESVEVGGVGV
jgi:hypothetical protein